MKTYYQAECALKHSAIDDYKDGQEINGNCFDMSSISYKAKTLEEVINKVKEFNGIDAEDKDGALEFNSCEETGRLDVSVMETVDGNGATDSDIALWKKSKKVLYACIYAWYITKAEAVDLEVCIK